MTTHMLLPAATRVWKPWKNGGGEMADIAVVPADAGYDDFKWRIAIAKIDGDRAFSNFPGIDRTFMVVGGKGVNLSVDGLAPARLTHKSPPFHFPGDKPTHAKLIDGPVHALNVMTKRGVADTRIGLADEAAEFHTGSDVHALLVWARGRADVLVDDTSVVLNQHDAVMLASGVHVKIKPGDHAHGYLIEVGVRVPSAPAA
jgi:uncharacterized protein